MNFFHQSSENKNLVNSNGLEPGEELCPSPSEEDKMLETVLFATKEPLTLSQLKKSCPNISDLEASLDRLRLFYKNRGINIVKIRNSYAFRTASRFGYLLKNYVEKKVKLSKAAKETLAIIAYHQPITRSEIETIRGVCIYKGLLDSLLETGWINLGPRRDAPGKPITFLTTNSFLDYFGLQTVRDMPNFQELKEAGLLSQKYNNSQESE